MTMTTKLNNNDRDWEGPTPGRKRWVQIPAIELIPVWETLPEHSCCLWTPISIFKQFSHHYYIVFLLLFYTILHFNYYYIIIIITYCTILHHYFSNIVYSIQSLICISFYNTFTDLKGFVNIIYLNLTKFTILNNRFQTFSTILNLRFTNCFEYYIIQCRTSLVRLYIYTTNAN